MLEPALYMVQASDNCTVGVEGGWGTWQRRYAGDGVDCTGKGFLSGDVQA
jgi:hypothetical protein